ncbi:MAG: hypothetical protein JJT96_08055 [Opitutales bacterium]|nr:hypothetical protein [Opitutales bacterium]
MKTPSLPLLAALVLTTVGAAPNLSAHGTLLPRPFVAPTGRSLEQIARPRGQPITQTAQTTFPIQVIGRAYLASNIRAYATEGPAILLYEGAELDLNGFAILSEESDGGSAHPAIAILTFSSGKPRTVVRNGFIGGIWRYAAREPEAVGEVGELVFQDMLVRVAGGGVRHGGPIRLIDCQMKLGLDPDLASLPLAHSSREVRLERTQVKGGHILAANAVILDSVIDGTGLAGSPGSFLRTGEQADHTPASRIERTTISGQQIDDGSGIPQYTLMPGVHEGAGSILVTDSTFAYINGKAIRTTGGLEVVRTTIHQTGGLEALHFTSPTVRDMRRNRLDTVVVRGGSVVLGKASDVRGSSFAGASLKVGDDALVEHNLIAPYVPNTPVSEIALEMGDHGRARHNHIIDADAEGLRIGARGLVEQNSFGALRGFNQRAALYLAGPDTVVRDNFFTGAPATSPPSGAFPLLKAVYGRDEAERLRFTGNLMANAQGDFFELPAENVFGNYRLIPHGAEVPPLHDPATTNLIYVHPTP